MESSSISLLRASLFRLPAMLRSAVYCVRLAFVISSVNCRVVIFLACRLSFSSSN